MPVVESGLCALARVGRNKLAIAAADRRRRDECLRAEWLRNCVMLLYVRLRTEAESRPVQNARELRGGGTRRFERLSNLRAPYLGSGAPAHLSRREMERIMAIARNAVRKSSGSAKRHDRVALVLQGGGALGAYQAGVYEELSGTAYQPGWIAGVSIGAINAALIAGNPPERRIQRLTEFWNLVSSGMGPLPGMLSDPHWLKVAPQADRPRGAFNQFSAFWAATLGVPGFYRPRIPPALFQRDGTPEALSVYDAAPLQST